MMTQFFQVLKRNIDLHNVPYEFYDDSILSGTKTINSITTLNIQFYDDSILSGTKTSNTIFHINVKQLYLSFA